jgi:hypothetical protein
MIIVWKQRLALTEEIHVVRLCGKVILLLLFYSKDIIL